MFEIFNDSSINEHTLYDIRFKEASFCDILIMFKLYFSFGINCRVSAKKQNEEEVIEKTKLFHVQYDNF